MSPLPMYAGHGRCAQVQALPVIGTFEPSSHKYSKSLGSACGSVNDLVAWPIGSFNKITQLNLNRQRYFINSPRNICGQK